MVTLGGWQDVKIHHLLTKKPFVSKAKKKQRKHSLFAIIYVKAKQERHDNQNGCIIPG